MHPIFRSSKEDEDTKNGCDELNLKDLDVSKLGTIKGLKWAAQNKPGSRCRRATKIARSKCWGRVLERMGCRGDSIREHVNRKGADGKWKVKSQTVGYRLDIASFERMARLSAKWQERLVARLHAHDIVPVDDPAVEEFFRELAA